MNKQIQIVLVLYKTTLNDSLSYKSLVEHIKSTTINFELLLYNNSPEVIVANDTGCMVVNSSSNAMLAGAYNYALKLATETNKDWILLLDQDTKLSKEYFEELEIFLNTESNAEFAAAIPVLFKKNLHLSPISYSAYLGPFMFFKPASATSAIKNKCVSGFNSAALVNVAFMNSIGGFSNDYPLDMLDHWYFYQMYKANKQVKILNAKLEQNLSLLEIDTAMSTGRYEKYVQSLFQFAHELKPTSFIFLELKLLQSLLSQLIRPKKRIFFRITLLSMLGFSSFSTKNNSCQ